MTVFVVFLGDEIQKIFFNYEDAEDYVTKTLIDNDKNLEELEENIRENLQDLGGIFEFSIIDYKVE